VDEVEVLAARLTHDAGIALIPAGGDALGDGAVELAEDGRAACEVERGEFLVGQHDACDFLRVPGDELDDVLREPCFEKDVVEEPIRRNRGVRGFPHYHVPHQRRRPGEIACNCRKVEGRNRIHEAL
jgi:hypothetical protein